MEKEFFSTKLIDQNDDQMNVSDQQTSLTTK